MTKAKLARLVSALAVLLFASVVYVSNISAAGQTCEQAIATCTKQITAVEEALAKVSEACEQSGSDGCKNAVANLETQLAAKKEACEIKVKEACQ